MNADESTAAGSSQVTRQIIGVFYGVYNELGFGFLESVYQESMAIALADAGLPCERERQITVSFRGRSVGEFRPDLVVADAVIVELKVARTLAAVHHVQVINYLRATPFELGLLLNFGPQPQIRRIAFSNHRKRLRPDLRSSA
jgi:GxxExxY protein